MAYTDKMGEKFALRLRELRKEADISARKMSLDLGQNPGYINNIENQRSFPTIPAFFQICEYLDVTPEYFFKSLSEKENQTYKTDINKLVNMLSSLDEKTLSALCVITKELIP